MKSLRAGFVGEFVVRALTHVSYPARGPEAKMPARILQEVAEVGEVGE